MQVGYDTVDWSDEQWRKSLRYWPGRELVRQYAKSVGMASEDGEYAEAFGHAAHCMEGEILERMNR